MIYFLMALLSFAITTVLCPVLIPLLRRMKFGQPILEEAPEEHKKKQGTPTMGGVTFILGSVLSTAVFFAMLGGTARVSLAVLLCALLFGVIGISDDLIKIRRKHNEGLTAKQKFGAQAVVAIGFLAYLYGRGLLVTELMLPFMKHPVSFGIFTLPFAVFVLLAMVNSVNLTDGLDGLASTTALVVAVFFAYLCYHEGESGVCGFLIALAAGLVGFLLFNHYPAKVFMGDTGSLFLGGALGAAAVSIGGEWFLVITGLVFLCETLAVIIQVTYFKATRQRDADGKPIPGTGKRIFRKTPLHHHFEECGMKETKVVWIFSTFTLICCIIAYFAIR